jgi:hypothetical protein
MDPSNVIEVVEVIQQVKEYWDQTGLDMHIAVKKNKMIAVSTKHFFSSFKK